MITILTNNKCNRNKDNKFYNQDTNSQEILIVNNQWQDQVNK